MTSIKIHGGNMVFHKRVAISVTLTAGTGGTATFSPASGTSYSLNSLPVGTTIVLENSTYKFKLNGTQIGSLTITASSGYGIDEVDVGRGGVDTPVTSTPKTLENGDAIGVYFASTEMTIYFMDDSKGNVRWDDMYNHISDVPYIKIPRADILVLTPNSQVRGNLSALYNGSYVSVATYEITDPNNFIFKAIISPDSPVQRPPIEFLPAEYSYEEFPTAWSLQSGYQYLDGMIIESHFDTPACELTDYQTAGLYGSDEIKTFFEQNYIYDVRFQGATMSYYNCPSSGNFDYVLSDGSFTYGIMVGEARYIVIDPNGQQRMENCRLIIPFRYMSGRMDAYPYDYMGQSSGVFTPRSNTNLNFNDSFAYYTFSYGSTQELEQWMYMWSCNDECDLIRIIDNLAQGYYQFNN